MELIINLLKIKKKLNINEFINEFQLNEEELLILYYINKLKENERYLTHISKLTLISKSKTSLIIDNLVKKNYVKRIHFNDNDDRRISKLELTNYGEDVLETSLFQITHNLKLLDYKPETILFTTNLLNSISKYFD